jgi:tetratricopeptide (TPR) repeat protein
VTGTSLKVLMALANKSLIQRAQDGRYQIHELLRQYAGGKLVQDPEKTDQLRDRHSEYFAEFLHQREAAIRSGDQGETLTEMDNIRLSLQWAVTREKIPEIQKQMQSLWWLYEFQGWFQEAVDTFEWAASVLGTDAPIGEKGIAFGQVLSQLGVFSVRTGQLEGGTQFIRKSQAILRQLDARWELAWANNFLGLFGELMDYGEREQYFQESLAIYEQMGLTWGIAGTHNCWGSRALWHDRYEEAESHYREAIQINSDLNDRRGMAWSLYGLGEVALRQGEYQKAKKSLEESYQIFEAIGYKLLVGSLLIGLGDVALLMGEYEDAQARHQEALGGYRGMGFQEGIAIANENLGNVALSIGEHEIAKEHYQEALARFQSLGDQNGVGCVFTDLGNVSVALGDHQEARARYHSAMEIGAAAQNVSLCLSVLAGSAALYEPASKAARAVELAALAQSHPRADPLTRERAKNLLDELGAKLPPEIFTAAQERGKALDLWISVDELLTELDV